MRCHHLILLWLSEVVSHNFRGFGAKRGIPLIDNTGEIVKSGNGPRALLWLITV
jgi:hypothetical protein